MRRTAGASPLLPPTPSAAMAPLACNGMDIAYFLSTARTGNFTVEPLTDAIDTANYPFYFEENHHEVEQT